MSGRTLSRTLRDLSAAAAFAGVAVSEQMPTVILVLFVAALVTALVGLRPFGRSPLLGATLLILAAGGIALLVYRGGLDPVVGAVSFTALLAANRMLAEPTPTSDRQVHLASLLMISGGAALSGELLFGLALLVFTGLAVVSLCLSTVEQAGSEGELPPVPPVLRTAARGALAILVLGAALFVLIPRLSWNVAPRRPSPSLSQPSTGFSDEVGLGGDGALKQDLRVVLRVHLQPDPGSDSLDGYWVGKHYLSFDGRRWRSDNEELERDATITLAPGGKRTVLNQVEVTPAFGAQTLVALDRPILYGGAVVRRPSGSERTELIRTVGDEVRFADRGLAYSYLAYSLPPQRETLLDADRPRALALPPGLDPRIRSLAASIAPGETDPAKVAHALEQYLRSHYRYSLQLNGEAQDPLADFLFVKRAGHCEHFATALAVLLRTRGIPSRVVSGFYGGERVDGAYVLRAGDAHAWTEAWVGNHWLRVDATPPEARTAQASEWAERLATLWEKIDALWRTQVVDYTMRDQMTAMNRLFGGGHGRSRGTRSAPVVRWVAALGILAMLAWAVFRMARITPLPPRRREVARLLSGTERLLTKHGRLPRPREDLQEWTRRLERERDPAAAALAQVTRRYLETRFGRSSLLPGERRALLERLEGALDAPRRAA